jgi:hypothetical protein
MSEPKDLLPGPLTYIRREQDYTDLIQEINLLSGRVDLTLRLIARIVAHMDQSFLDDPFDPEVRHRSKLLGETVLEKIKDEALGLATGDPEQTNRLRRYFKDIP